MWIETTSYERKCGKKIGQICERRLGTTECRLPRVQACVAKRRRGYWVNILNSIQNIGRTTQDRL